METAEEIGISQAQVSRLEKKRTQIHEKIPPHSFKDFSLIFAYNNTELSNGVLCESVNCITSRLSIPVTAKF